MRERTMRRPDPPPGRGTTAATEPAGLWLLQLNRLDVDLALLHFPCSSWDDTLAMYRDLEAARDRGSQA